jgi:hypothetical protein
VRAVFDWTARVVGWRGWAFEAWSGADARLLANVQFLAGYRRAQVVEQTLIAPVMGMAEQQGTVGGIERAAAALAPAVLVRPVVLHLLWSGRLRTDLSSPIGAASAVSLVEGVPS